MRYRIKKIEYSDGTVKYHPQVKRWWGWTSLFYDGAEITWLSRYRIRPYQYEPALYSTPEGCNTAIKRHKYLYKHVVIITYPKI